MAEKLEHIFVVSDATGQTCERVAKAALAQFEGHAAELHRKNVIRTPQEIERVLREAKELDAVVVYTLVGDEERRTMARAAEEMGISVVDVLGPLLERFAELLERDPAEIPGLFQDLIEDH
jgi:regulator of PEP synthase PpsR (kinase-PPPase family)